MEDSSPRSSSPSFSPWEVDCPPPFLLDGRHLLFPPVAIIEKLLPICDKRGTASLCPLLQAHGMGSPLMPAPPTCPPVFFSYGFFTVQSGGSLLFPIANSCAELPPPILVSKEGRPPVSFLLPYGIGRSRKTVFFFSNQNSLPFFPPRPFFSPT